MSLFDRFGGVRPMARKCEEASGTVSGWKRRGRIPAEKQPHVLAVGQAMGLGITAEDVVFPLGRPASDAIPELPSTASTVACDHASQTQADANRSANRQEGDQP